MSHFQRKDGRWVVKLPKGITHQGRGIIYCGRGQEGEDRARRLDEQYGVPRGPSGPSFYDLALQYAESTISRNTATTRSRNIYRFDGILIPFFGNVSAYRIDHDLLDKYVSHRRMKTITRGGIHSVKMTTIRRELAIVRAIMSWALRRGKISVDGTAGYEMPEIDNYLQPPPTPAELVSIIEKSPDHLRRAIYLSFYTALRPGTSELFKLKWSNVDFGNRSIFVESAKKGGINYRVVPLNDIIYRLLQQWHREDMGYTTPPEYIISWHGKQVQSVKTAWNKAKSEAKIKRVLKFYSIRHAATTALVTSGADPRTVCGITGNTLEVMLTHYHASSNALREKAVSGLPDLTKPQEVEERKVVRVK